MSIPNISIQLVDALTFSRSTVLVAPSIVRFLGVSVGVGDVWCMSL